jgi:hypothetical protein
MDEFSIYKDVVVPLVSTLLGGLLGVLSGLLVAARSETFRRLASWEPYARDLWSKQVDLCCETLTVSDRALSAAIYCFDVFNPNAESQQEFASRLGQHLADLHDLKGQRLALCTPNLNQAVEMFSQQLGVVLQQYSAGNLNQKLSGNLPNLWVSLVDDIRAELRVERLDAEARAVLEKASKAPTFDPTGNPTLPY